MTRKYAYLFIFLAAAFSLSVLGSQSATADSGKYTVAYQSMVDEEFQIFMLDLGNPSAVSQITKGKNGSKHPSMVSTGKRIYYYHWTPTNWGDMNLLYYQDMDKRKEYQVQRNSIHEEEDPCISRDGSTLAYRTTQSIKGEFGTDNWEINALKTDFSIANRITTTLNEEMDPCLNGNGDTVYFAIRVERDRTEIEKNEILDAAEENDEEIDEADWDFLHYNRFFIFRNSFEGDNLERVTPQDYDAWHPSVDADENFMVFASDMDGNEEIYVLDLNTWESTRITNYEGYDGHPQISSDGEVIVFVSDRDGDKEIFSINRNGTNLVQITNNDVEDDNPTIT